MANIRLNLPNTGIRLSNTGKWTAVVLGKFKGDFTLKSDAIKAAGTDKEI